MNRVAVLQSNYIPWKGYFDIIHDADIFVFYDDVQYTKNDWRNRNKIRVQNGTKWLTLPCGYDIKRTINNVEIKNTINWQKQHYEAIIQNYKKAPYFDYVKDFLDDVYIQKKWDSLSQLNQYCIKYISEKFLNMGTKFINSSDYSISGDKEDRLLSLLKKIKTDIYISGPAAKNYICEENFNKEKIDIVWKDYSGYPKYSQVYDGFIENVTILDLLLNTGEDAKNYIWGWRKYEL